MANDLGNHVLETYKSMIQISVEAFRLLFLLNGGAAVALGPYFGSDATRHANVTDLHGALACYLVGLSLSVLAFGASYMTQLRLFNEELKRPSGMLHQSWMMVAALVSIGSLVAFGVGSFRAVHAFG